MKICEQTPRGEVLRMWSAESYKIIGGAIEMRNAYSILPTEGPRHFAIVHPLSEHRQITVDLEPGERG